MLGLQADWAEFKLCGVRALARRGFLSKLGRAEAGDDTHPEAEERQKYEARDWRSSAIMS